MNELNAWNTFPHIDLKEMRSKPDQFKAFLALFYQVSLSDLEKAIQSIDSLAHSHIIQRDEDFDDFNKSYKGAEIDLDSPLGYAVSNYMWVMEESRDSISDSEYLATYVQWPYIIPFLEGLRNRYGRIMEN